MKKPYRYLDKEGVQRVALGIIGNKYFLSTQIPPERAKFWLESIFMPLTFINNRTRKAMRSRDVVCFYEEYDKAVANISGYPMFLSMWQMTREDFREVSETERRLRDAIQAAL